MKFTNTFNFWSHTPVACFLEVFSHYICYWSELLLAEMKYFKKEKTESKQMPSSELLL